MPLTPEEIRQIAKTVADEVMERLSPAYEDPPTVQAGLMESMEEEHTAAQIYRARARHAVSQGDEKTAKLYEHIAEEEEGHYKEFGKRAKDAGSQDIFSGIAGPGPWEGPFGESFGPKDLTEARRS